MTVGRFQVTPSLDIPAPAGPPGAEPPALRSQPEVSSTTPSESSTEEQGESETSLGTSLTMSPPHPQHHRGSAGLLQEVDAHIGRPVGQEQQERQQQDRRGEEEEENEEEDGEDEEEEEEGAAIVAERPRTRRRSRRRAYSLSLMGTSVDSGLSVTAAEVEGRLWDGAAGSPQYTNALHHLWMMTYNSRNTPYLSSDDSDSDDEEMLVELQELREK